MHVGDEGLRQRGQIKRGIISEIVLAVQATAAAAAAAGHGGAGGDNVGGDGDDGGAGRGGGSGAVLQAPPSHHSSWNIHEYISPIQQYLVSSPSPPQMTGSPLPPSQPSLNSSLSSTQLPAPSKPSHLSWNIDIPEVDQTLSIYRVRKSLREVDQTAYTPTIVSLGPYHHRHGLDIHGLKPRGFKMALNRAGKVNDDLCYYEVARPLEDHARNSYEDTLDIESDVFVQSLIHDAIFTLELFRGVAGESFKKLGYESKVVSAFRRDIYSFQIDMLMLENQLPLFVLENILDHQLKLESEPSPCELDRILTSRLGHQASQLGRVASLALLFFENFRLTDKNSAAPFGSVAGSSKGRKAHHCLDLFRRSLIGLETDSAPSKPLDKQHLQSIHCITELYDAGIELRQREKHRFWDIKFEDGVLHIPRLLIHDWTKSLFHNLLAFEERNSECSTRITSYVFFMANLIKSEMDVGNNDGEVANLFNQLRQGVVVDRNKSYISELWSKQVNDYYKIPPHKKKTTLSSSAKTG